MMVEECSLGEVAFPLEYGNDRGLRTVSGTIWHSADFVPIQGFGQTNNQLTYFLAISKVTWSGF